MFDVYEQSSGPVEQLESELYEREIVMGYRNSLFGVQNGQLLGERDSFGVVDMSYILL